MDDHVRSGTEVADGLRGLAILMVVTYHLWLFSWYTPPGALGTFARTGYFGVELFFVLSGFCLFYPYARHAVAGTARAGLREFAYRRFLKIAPSYWLALIATVAIAFPYFAHKSNVLMPLALHLAFINNWHADLLGWLDGAFWSLAVEVQFYLLFPLLALAFMRFPLAAVIACAGIAFAYRYGLDSRVMEPLIVQQVPAYLDVFGAGMFAAYAVVYVRAKAGDVERLRPRFTLLALGAVAGAAALLFSADALVYAPQGQQHWNLIGRSGLALALGTGLAASCLSFAWWRRLVANRLLVVLSLISYNVYLWHALVMEWLVLRGLRPENYKAPFADGAWKLGYVATALGITLLVSIAITYFIERPLLATDHPLGFSFRWRRRL